MWPFAPPYPALTPADVGISLASLKDPDSLIPTYDYIIVGGGTAGCCLASRLSEDSGVSVLLIERGSVVDTWVNRVPLLSSDLFKEDSISRPSKSLPQNYAHNRILTIMRGEALGGGSRVNAMIYTRGVPADFNRWRDMGHPDWGYDGMLPYFVKSETSLNQPASYFRGQTGPWENQTFPSLPWPILPHVKDAAKSIGIPFCKDYNDPRVPSVSISALDIATDKNMRRSSTYSAFIPPAVAQARKDRLKICPDSLVTRVVFDSKISKKPRAIGVEFAGSKESNQGITYFAKARREVVICCGAIGTPQLLLLSGIGPAEHLQDHEIDVVLDNPGVGSHLKDHVDIPVMWNIPLDESMHVLLEKPWRAIYELVKYILTGNSLFGWPFVHMAIFLPSRLINENTEITTADPTDLDSTLPKNAPDLELKPMTVYGLDPPPNSTTIRVKEGVFNFMTCLLRPHSSGTVRLSSANPYERPSCDLGVLSAPEDVHVLAKGVRLALRLGEQIRAQGYPIKNFYRPSSDSDKDVEEYIRTNARTGYHYTSSCRMAPFDDIHLGVVDDQLRVHGVNGLRLCDTSVFPDILAAHTMAPVVAVAEKCADMIRASYR